MRFYKILFTAFYTGYLPVAPGTAGTVVGMAIYILEYLLFGVEISWIVNIIVVVLVLYPSIRIADAGEMFFGEKDPPEVVIDEVIGYWVSVIAFPFNWKIVVLAFFIFRLIDIIKPYPLKRLQRLSAGLGIVIDDIVAGLYTNLLLIIVVLVSKYFGMPIY